MASTTKLFSNNNPPSCEDEDLNGFKNENNNLITGSGQSLSTADNQQTQKAVAAYAAGGDFYTDSGAADAYVLSPVGAKLAPEDYFEGMRVRFVPSNTNTGPSTINVATLGVLDIHLEGGTADPAAGQIIAGREMTVIYRTSPGAHLELQAPTGAFRGALVFLDANQSLTDAVPAALSFEQETYDTDSIHDNATNPTRLTVPSGVTKVRLTGQIAYAAGTSGLRQARIEKDGAQLEGTPQVSVVSAGSDYLNVTSAVLPVAGGNYFELIGLQISGGALNAVGSAGGVSSWFGMEIVE